ncbi:MAG TPA: MBL fold metallo-hydrolase [Gaiellales bacterium]
MTALPQSGGWTARLLEAGSLLMTPEQLAPDGGLDEPLAVPSNVLLLERGGRRVLVDCGAGPYASTWPGGVDRLADALGEAGVEQRAIDTVVLTHLAAAAWASRMRVCSCLRTRSRRVRLGVRCSPAWTATAASFGSPPATRSMDCGCAPHRDTAPAIASPRWATTSSTSRT